jgi:hypothetical protein
MELSAGIVAGLGNAAGGAAASAVMGNTSAPSGGGITGLTTSQGSGKDHNQGTATQIDPSTALGYFQQAAQSYQTNALQGLSYYGNAINTAVGQINAGYKSANQTLAPLSNASNQALNQELQMMGITPVAASAQYSSDVSALGSQYSSLANQMSAAESLTDPDARAAAKASIVQNFQTATAAPNVAAQIAALGPRPTLLSTQGTPGAAGLSGILAGGVQNATSAQDTINSTNNNLTLDQQNYDAKVANIQSSAAQQSSTDSQLQNILGQWQGAYTNDAQLGYTGDQVTDKIESTPGYAFTMQQGTDALSASQAAKGMLDSGNTALAIQGYGQNQALQYYNQYMNNLANIQQQGAPATGQIASNQVNQGQNLASLSQSLGQAGMDTYQGIGQANYNAYTNSGNTWNQDMLANMQSQNAAIMQQRGLNAGAAQSGMQAGVQLAGMQQQRQNSQQVGNGYLNI